MKILLAKLNHLGDTLLLTPAIHFLKEHFPAAEIDVLVRAGCEEVLRGNPAVHRVFSVGGSREKRAFSAGARQLVRNARGIMLRRYDYAFDLADSGKAKLWILLSGARIRGINDAYHSVGWQRALFNRVSYFEWGTQHQVLRDFRTVAHIMELKGEPGALRFYPQAGPGSLQSILPPGPYAVIHPASRWAFKQWLPERWAAVADRLLREQALRMVFSCGPDKREKNLVRDILARSEEKHTSTEGALSLHQLGLLLQGAKVFLVWIRRQCTWPQPCKSVSWRFLVRPRNGAGDRGKRGMSWCWDRARASKRAASCVISPNRIPAWRPLQWKM